MTGLAIAANRCPTAFIGSALNFWLWRLKTATHGLDVTEALKVPIQHGSYPNPRVTLDSVLLCFYRRTR